MDPQSSASKADMRIPNAKMERAMIDNTKAHSTRESVVGIKHTYEGPEGSEGRQNGLTCAARITPA
jgi:hypothetical protein